MAKAMYSGNWIASGIHVLARSKVMFCDFLRCCMTLIGAGQGINGRGLLQFTVSDR